MNETWKGKQITYSSVRLFILSWELIISCVHNDYTENLRVTTPKTFEVDSKRCDALKLSAFVLKNIPTTIVSTSRYQNLVNKETVYPSLSAKNSFFSEVLVHIAASRRHVFSLFSYIERERQVQGRIDNWRFNSHLQTIVTFVYRASGGSIR